jgi:catechol 2,3-dioxygenase-like lactoylglutathione lyase family enzyme
VFNHVSVTCADLERSLAFYHELLGLPIRSRGITASAELSELIGFQDARLRYAELDLGAGTILELIEYLSPRGASIHSRTCDAGSTHFALTVDNIAEVHRRFSEAGVETRSGPVTVSSTDSPDVTAFYSLDPDGVTVELIGLTPSRTVRQ